MNQRNLDALATALAANEEFERGIRPRNAANTEALYHLIIEVFRRWNSEGYSFQDGRSASRLAGLLSEAAVLVPSTLTDQEIDALCDYAASNPQATRQGFREVLESFAKGEAS